MSSTADRVAAIRERVRRRQADKKKFGELAKELCLNPPLQIDDVHLEAFPCLDELLYEPSMNALCQAFNHQPTPFTPVLFLPKTIEKRDGGTASCSAASSSSQQETKEKISPENKKDKKSESPLSSEPINDGDAATTSGSVDLSISDDDDDESTTTSSSSSHVELSTNDGDVSPPTTPKSKSTTFVRLDTPDLAAKREELEKKQIQLEKKKKQLEAQEKALTPRTRAVWSNQLSRKIPSRKDRALAPPRANYVLATPKQASHWTTRNVIEWAEQILLSRSAIQLIEKSQVDGKKLLSMIDDEPVKTTLGLPDDQMALFNNALVRLCRPTVPFTTKPYTSWSQEDLYDWLISLEQVPFSAIHLFYENELEGQDIDCIDEPMLKEDLGLGDKAVETILAAVNYILDGGEAKFEISSSSSSSSNSSSLSTKEKDSNSSSTTKEKDSNSSSSSTKEKDSNSSSSTKTKKKKSSLRRSISKSSLTKSSSKSSLKKSSSKSSLAKSSSKKSRSRKKTKRDRRSTKINSLSITVGGDDSKAQKKRSKERRKTQQLSATVGRSASSSSAPSPKSARSRFNPRRRSTIVSALKKGSNNLAMSLGIEASSSSASSSSSANTAPKSARRANTKRTPDGPLDGYEHEPVGEIFKLVGQKKRSSSSGSKPGSSSDTPRDTHNRQDDDKEPIWDAFVHGDEEDGIVLKPIKDGETQHRFNVKYGTLNALILLLTSSKQHIEQTHHEYFSENFLATYRSFTEPPKLLKKLVDRFFVPKEIMEKLDDNTPARQELVLIQKTTIQTIRHWFQNHFRDFDNETTRLLQEFTRDALAYVDKLEKADPVRVIVRFLEKTVEKKLAKGTYTSMFTADKMVIQPPEPILPKNVNWRTATFMDIDPKEIARQITIADQHLYSEMQPVEFMNLAWSKPKLKHRAPNLLEMVNRFNMLSEVGGTLLTMVDSLKGRKVVLKKLVAIMQQLFLLNNYNGVMAFLSSFNSSAVHRLHHTFAELSKKEKAFLEEAQEIFSSNRSFAVYRAKFGENTTPPCIPFFGVYLTDLTFIEDGNPDDVQGMINFYKRTLQNSVIKEVLKYQMHAYNFKYIAPIQKLISRLPRWDEERVYKRSLEIEPRGSSKKDIK